jgi:WD40 repeat protein
MTFSPNGSSLVFAGFGNTMTVWDPRTGMLRHTIEVRPVRPEVLGDVTAMEHPRFSPDGRFLAAIAYKNGIAIGFVEPKLRVWETNTWQELPLFDEQGPRGDYYVEILWPTFAPDGRAIAAIDQNRDRTQRIRIWEVGTGRTRRTINLERGHPAGLTISADAVILPPLWTTSFTSTTSRRGARFVVSTAPVANLLILSSPPTAGGC